MIIRAMSAPKLKRWEILPSTGSHFDVLDGLRGAAILLVVSYHALYTNPASGMLSRLAGDVFIADTGNNRVVELPAGGGAQITLPATGLNQPRKVAIDAAGDVFIADTSNARVVELPAGGGAQTVVRVGGGAGAVGIDVHEDGGALAGRIGDPFERSLDERAARRASGGEVGGKLG